MEFRLLVKQHLTAVSIILAGAFVLAGPRCGLAEEKAGPAEEKAGPADWPNWRGPDHNGVSKETGWKTTWPAEGPKVLWKASVGTGFSSFAVSSGKVYTMGNTDNTDMVFCFDAETGKEVWKHSYQAPLDKSQYEGGPNSTPTVDDTRVYTFSKRGQVYCLDVGTGKVIWSKKFLIKPPTWNFAGSPLVMGRLVILNAGTQGLALNKLDGAVVWQNGEGLAGYATPVPFKMIGRECVAIFTQKAAVGLLAENGKELWRIAWETQYDANIPDPIIYDDKVFLSSGYGTGCGLYQIAHGQPNQIWRNRSMRNHFNSCVPWKGSVYGFDESTLTCMDWATGTVKWTDRGLGKGSLMAADGKLILLGEGGKLVIADASPEGFKPLAEAQILRGKCWTTPVLSGGRIYARNAPGDVVCVDVKQ